MLKFEWSSPAARAKALASREVDLGLLEIPNERRPRRFALSATTTFASAICALVCIAAAAAAEDSSNDKASVAPAQTTTEIASTSTMPAVPAAPRNSGRLCARADVMIELPIVYCKLSRVDTYTIAAAVFFVLTIVFATLGGRIFSR